MSISPILPVLRSSALLDTRSYSSHFSGFSLLSPASLFISSLTSSSLHAPSPLNPPFFAGRALSRSSLALINIDSPASICTIAVVLLTCQLARDKSLSEGCSNSKGSRSNTTKRAISAAKRSIRRRTTKCN